MNELFEELGYEATSIGELSLRRRREPRLDVDVYEIKLGDEFLMSSLFTASEIALARAGLDVLGERRVEVVVGGLGLGYTARAVLDYPNVAELIVVELLEPVIDWHRNGVLPLGPELTGDERCRFVAGNFFDLARSRAGFDPLHPERGFDAILVDIDHSPDALLDEGSSGFYQPQGLGDMAKHLKPDGVFGLWSNDLPDPRFTRRLAEVFASAWEETVTFHNPLQNRPFTQTIYLARRG